MFDIVTGGAGFIGSHLVDTLVKRGDQVTVIDSLSAGSRNNISSHLEKSSIEFLSANLLSDGWQKTFDGADRIYHLAADPDVRQSALAPEGPLNHNIFSTFRVLEAMRLYNVPEIVFTSTSTVYGDATIFPTPEEYTPLEPISVYGASKLGCEALIAAYCHSFSMKSWIFRFANIVGQRSNHGVIPDFITKLKENSREMEILGDGKQTKSYLGVQECVEAMLFVVENAHRPVNTFNIGSEDWIDVRTIADIVADEMHLKGVRYRFTGGERGWIGDVPKMHLSLKKINALGWKPKRGSKDSVHMAVRAMLGN
ncbi:MAG: NAD-dependent epimerase/dehydratase family protein [Methanoregulaceae archaeon]